LWPAVGLHAILAVLLARAWFQSQKGRSPLMKGTPLPLATRVQCSALADFGAKRWRTHVTLPP
jgi:hypothetical protein